MKTGIVSIVILLFGFLTVFSCNQDPIFYYISQETAPIPPLIKGSPTKLVVFEREYSGESVPILYVASGSLYWYARNAEDTKASWNLEKYRIASPAENPGEGISIVDLAVTTKHLYVLYRKGQGVDTVLRRIGPESGASWETIVSDASDYPLIQSIYADPDSDRLFAGGAKNDRTQATYGILYLDGDKLKLLKGGTTVFSGAAYRASDNTHYLCTMGSGIFQADENDITNVKQLTDNSNISSTRTNRTFMGMIKLKNAENTIIAVERSGGILYEVKKGSFEQIRYTGGSRNGQVMATGRYTTGALALWEDYVNITKDEDSYNSNTKSSTKRLVAGIQGTVYYYSSSSSASYTHGYVEFELDSDGSLRRNAARRDPGNLSTVRDQSRYTSSLGKHPVKHLLQAPWKIDKENMTFFASTQTSGLWSYRNRPNNGGWQWNAESSSR